MRFTLKVNPHMTDFIVKKLPYDLNSHASLAFIGKYLKRINVNALIDRKFPVRSGVSNSEILKSYLALLCMGKSDFDAVESFRDNAFFKCALGLRA
jgi:hypothetical protein